MGPYFCTMVTPKRVGSLIVVMQFVSKDVCFDLIDADQSNSRNLAKSGRSISGGSMFWHH